MGTTAMKMSGYVPPAFVTNIDIGGLWEFARPKLLRGWLLGIKIQCLHQTRLGGLLAAIVLNYLASNAEKLR